MSWGCICCGSSSSSPSTSTSMVSILFRCNLFSLEISILLFSVCVVKGAVAGAAGCCTGGGGVTAATTACE